MTVRPSIGTLVTTAPVIDKLGWPIHLSEEVNAELMRGSTGISWTRFVLPDGTFERGFTFNAWRGCIKCATECKFCYADVFMKSRRKLNLWGPTARRLFASESTWRRLAWLDRLALKLGHPIKVFCHSLSDVFETLPAGHPDASAMTAARARLFGEVEARKNVVFIFCTKRIEDVMGMVPAHWRSSFPPNLWILGTAGTQANVDRIVPELLKIPAAVLGLSIEPMLTPIQLPNAFLALGGRGWAICGGESGNLKQAIRPTHPDWFRDLRDQCDAAGLPFFFKQVGDWSHDSLIAPGSALAKRVAALDPNGKLVHTWHDGSRSYRLSKRANGRELDSREWNQFPC